MFVSLTWWVNKKLFKVNENIYCTYCITEIMCLLHGCWDMSCPSLHEKSSQMWEVVNMGQHFPCFSSLGGKCLTKNPTWHLFHEGSYFLCFPGVELLILTLGQTVLLVIYICVSASRGHSASHMQVFNHLCENVLEPLAINLYGKNLISCRRKVILKQLCSFLNPFIWL